MATEEDLRHCLSLDVRIFNDGPSRVGQNTYNKSVERMINSLVFVDGPDGPIISASCDKCGAAFDVDPNDGSAKSMTTSCFDYGIDGDTFVIPRVEKLNIQKMRVQL